MKTVVKFFPTQFGFIHSFYKNIMRTGFILLVLAMSAFFLAGCGESSSTGSSSTASSDASQAETSAAAESTASSAVSSSASNTSSASSTQSDNGYVLPAGSSSRVNSSVASAGSSVQPASSAPSTSSQTNSAAKTTFGSVFGNSSQSNSSEAARDNSGSKVSENEYDQIENGMSYAQVKSIIGGDGKVSREFGDKNSEFYSVTYRWTGNGVSSSYAEVTFEKGVVSSKIQFGLN